MTPQYDLPRSLLGNLVYGACVAVAVGAIAYGVNLLSKGSADTLPDKGISLEKTIDNPNSN